MHTQKKENFFTADGDTMFLTRNPFHNMKTLTITVTIVGSSNPKYIGKVLSWDLVYFGEKYPYEEDIRNKCLNLSTQTLYKPSDIKSVETTYDYGYSYNSEELVDKENVLFIDKYDNTFLLKDITKAHNNQFSIEYYKEFGEFLSKPKEELEEILKRFLRRSGDFFLGMDSFCLLESNLSDINFEKINSEEMRYCFDLYKNFKKDSEVLKNKAAELTTKINDFLKNEDFHVDRLRLKTKRIHGIEIKLLQKEGYKGMGKFNLDHNEWNKFLNALKSEYDISDIFIDSLYWID